MTTLSKWQCKVCTLINEYSNNTCAVCGNSKLYDESVDQWPCSVCGCTTNSLSQEDCKQCKAPSPIKNDLFNKKICPKCTMINDISVVHCIVCDENFNANRPSPMDIDYNQENENSSADLNDHNYDMNISNTNQQNHDLIENSNETNNNSIYNDMYSNIFNNSYNNTNNNINNNFNNYVDNVNSSNNNNEVNYNISGFRYPNRNFFSPFAQRKNSSNIHNHNSNLFKDVKEIFNKDANEVDRIKKEQEEIKKFEPYYKHTYKNKTPQNHKKIEEIILELYKLAPIREKDDIKNNENDVSSKHCSSCYEDYNNTDTIKLNMIYNCNHSSLCINCLKKCLSIRIRDKEVTPWLQCTYPHCLQPIHPRLLFQLLTLSELYEFAQIFLNKYLARNPNWIPCQGKNCEYGFVVFDNKDQTLPCSMCKFVQNVSKNPLKQDKGFQELLKSDQIRLCPKCQLPTMKDKGMCNIIHCGKCDIWWNWRTKEYGNNSIDLKNKARHKGTLWEPGEFEYQRRLQNENLSEFIKLLERNGIKYNSKYIRGT